MPSVSFIMLGGPMLDCYLIEVIFSSQSQVNYIKWVVLIIEMKVGVLKVMV